MISQISSNLPRKKWFFSLWIINCLFIHIQKGFLDSAKYLESSYTFFNRDRTTLKCFGWSLSNQFIILLKWSEFVNNQYVQLTTGQRSSSTHSRPGDCVMKGRNILQRYLPRIPPFFSHRLHLTWVLNDFNVPLNPQLP